MTPADAIKKLEVALKQFGTYNYYDKGVDAVYDASQEVSYVRGLASADAIRFLQGLSTFEHGEHLAQHIVMCLDDADETWFDEVVEGCRKAGLEVY